MASNTIAKASLMLTADSGGMNQGLSEAQQKLRSWGDQAGKTGEEAGKKLLARMKDALDTQGMSPWEKAMHQARKGGASKEQLSQMQALRKQLEPPEPPKEGHFGKMASGLESGLGKIGAVGVAFMAVTKAVELVGAAVRAVVDTVVSLVQRMSQEFLAAQERLLSVGKAARELGTDVQGFAAINYAAKVAGVSTEDLRAGLARLQQNLLGTDPGKVFERLGLSVAQLRNLPIDEAVARIAKGLAGINDPAERARVALGIFGEKAIQLAPLLMQGEEGIRQLAEEARKLGIAMDGSAVEAMDKGRQAMERLKGSWQGILNNVAVAFAPLVEGIARWVKGWTDSLARIYDARGNITEFGKEVLAAMRAGGIAVGGFIDGLIAMGVAILYTIALWAKMKAMMQFGLNPNLNAIADWAKNLANSLEKGIGKTSEAMKAIFDEIEKAAKEGGKNAGDKGGKGLAEGMNQAMINIQGSILALEKEMREAMLTPGFTSPQKKIFDLKMNFSGISGEQLNGLKKMAEAAKNVDIAFNNVQMTPLEQFERSLKGLDTLLANGRLSWEQYSLAINNASKALMQAVGMGDIKTVNAQLKDSSAAVSSIIKSDLQDRVNQDPAKELQKAIIEAKEINKRQLKVAEELLQVTREQGGVNIQVI